MMARLPQPGRVKTRLAATVGNEVASEFYRLCAERLLRESDRLPQHVHRYLFYAGAPEEAVVQRWAHRILHYEAQQGRDLGQRLAHAFFTVFARGAHKAVVVGSDIPDLSAGAVREALRLLDRYQVVIGPDHGGGYYLLGMKMLYPELFRNVSWGTSAVYGQTLHTVVSLGLSAAILPTLVDVDTEADLRRWLSLQPAEERLQRQIAGLLGG
jgi:rSAM/selenodomain-associated transferase 1